MWTLFEVLWWIPTRLWKWFIPFGRHSNRGIGAVASDCWEIKNWQCFSGVSWRWGHRFLRLLLPPCMALCPRDGEGDAQGWREDDRWIYFLRSGVGLPDSSPDTLKWQLLVDGSLEIVTPYSPVCQWCVEGRCSFGRFEYKS